MQPMSSMSHREPVRNTRRRTGPLRTVANATVLPIDTADSVPTGESKKDTTWMFTQRYKYEFTLKFLDEPNEPELLWLLLKEYAKSFVFQLEKGKEGGDLGYIHFQGCFSLITKHRASEVKSMFGRNDIHLEASRNWNALVNYCKKPETRISGPWDQDFVWLDVIKELRPWQKDVVKLIDEHLNGSFKDDRTIWWFHDPVGKAGKTVFCKYLAFTYKATILGNAKSADIAYAVNPASTKVAAFNLTRTTEGRINYQAIEQVKDGMLFSGKYQSQMKFFNSPLVLVFCNYLPDFDAMSKDRWCIVALSEEPRLEIPTLPGLPSIPLYNVPMGENFKEKYDAEDARYISQEIYYNGYKNLKTPKANYNY